MHVAPFAASEADLWVYDRKTKVALVGDLVVDIVPFMDSACPDGWAKALDEIEKVPFETLIPGHGAPMTRADFVQWKTAYNNMIACGRSSVDIAMCAAGWERDAAKFIDDGSSQGNRRSRRAIYHGPSALVAGETAEVLQDFKNSQVGHQIGRTLISVKPSRRA